MIINFDFNLEAWVKQLQIEADSEEAAKEKLMSMTLSEILSDDSLATDSNFKISDIDSSIVEYDVIVKVTDIEYDFETEKLDPAIIEYLKARLPKEREYTINGISPSDLEEELIKDEILADTSYEAKSFKFQILAKK
jgi:galactitol-specific phosphotransferase system IIB component